MHCSVTAVMHLTSLGASKHKSPLFQPLEHWPVSWSLEKGQRWCQCELGVTVCCASMALECSEFLQRSKVLFPAHGPVFSSPVRAPHNWGLCSLWSSAPRSVYAGREESCCRVWDDMNSLVHSRPYPLFDLCVEAFCLGLVEGYSFSWLDTLFCSVEKSFLHWLEDNNALYYKFCWWTLSWVLFLCFHHVSRLCSFLSNLLRILVPWCLDVLLADVVWVSQSVFVHLNWFHSVWGIILRAWVNRLFCIVIINPSTLWVFHMATRCRGTDCSCQT